MGHNFGNDLDLSEDIPEQIKKRAKPVKRSNPGKKVFTVDLVIMLHHSLLESQYLGHLRLLDQLPHKK